MIMIMINELKCLLVVCTYIYIYAVCIYVHIRCIYTHLCMYVCVCVCVRVCVCLNIYEIAGKERHGKATIHVFAKPEQMGNQE